MEANIQFINNNLIKPNSKILSNSKKPKKKSKKKTNNVKIDKAIDNNRNENIPKTIKVRNPGIDLIRLICMYGIVINHILFWQIKKGGKYERYSKQLKILDIIFYWHNDGFALISGIVGYKTNKYSNLLYLWLCVFFYSVSIHFYFLKFIRNPIIKDSINVEYFPIIYIRYWYFTAYFGMYLILPVINKGISILTKYELRLVVISTLGIYVFWRRIKNPINDVFHLMRGFSTFWLLILYITGAYIGKYRVDYTGIKKLIYCLICLFIFFYTTFLFYKSIYIGFGNINGYYKRKIIELLYLMLNEDLDSPIRIIQSLSITLFLLQIKYNKYLSKIISFFGQLTFGVYLLHINILVDHNIIPKLFMNDPNNLSSNSTIILFLVKTLKVYSICILIDFLRHLIFTILRIRKICIFLEKIVIKIFSF